MTETVALIKASTNGLHLCGFHSSDKVEYDPSVEDCKDGTVVPRTTTPTVPASTNGLWLCGYHPFRKVKYDPLVKECKDGKVVPRTTTPTLSASMNGKRPCGFQPNKVMYDPSVKECKDGKVVPRTTTSTFSDKLTTAPTNSSSILHLTTTGALKSTEDVLKGRNCNEKRISRVYKCCGLKQVYRPDFDTCCREMSKVEIYPNSPEKENVCCGTHIYPRTKPVCRHPALNDRLWDTHPRVDKRAYKDLCTANYVFLIKAIPQRGQIVLQPVKPTGKRLQLPFKTDNYTPTTRLPKNSIILATRKDLSKAHDFIATGTDTFYTVRRQRKSRRKLQRALRRRC